MSIDSMKRSSHTVKSIPKVDKNVNRAKSFSLHITGSGRSMFYTSRLTCHLLCLGIQWTQTFHIFELSETPLTCHDMWRPSSLSELTPSKSSIKGVPNINVLIIKLSASFVKFRHTEIKT